MELIQLKTNLRKARGKGGARTLRREGSIPAVLYGPNTDPISLALNKKEFEEILEKNIGKQTFFNIITDDQDFSNKRVMIKEFQRDPVTYELLHVDFYEFAAEQKIRINVPIKTIGKAKGVEFGGILQIIRREIEIFCLSLKIPDAIELDITDLDIGDSIHVEDIPLEEGIEIPADVNFTILTVLSQKKEEEEEEKTEEDMEEEKEEAEEEKKRIRKSDFK